MAWFGSDVDRHHDFGVVIGRAGLALDHEYRLDNPTDEPITIVRAINLKSCCGTIHLDKPTIEPGGSATLRVTVRVGETIGPISHHAAIETDQLGSEPVDFWTTVIAHPRGRIEATTEESPVILANEEAGRDFVALTYGTPSDPPLAPDDSTVLASLDLEWGGPAADRILGDGLIERRRPFAVRFPGDGRVGARVDQITLVDGDQVILRHPLHWEVVAAIQATPPGIVASEPTPIERSVLLRSRDGRAFRIEAITSEIPGVEAMASTDGSQPVHAIQITVTPSAANSGTPGRVRVATDHPVQPAVEVPVFIAGLPRADESGDSP